MKQKQMLFWNSSALSIIQWMLAIWSLVHLLFIPRLCIWMFSVHILLKPSLKDFEHNPASMWNEYNCMVVWIFFGVVLLWDWNENWPFLVLWPLLSFPNLLIDQNSSRIFLLEIDNLIPSFMWKCKRTRLTKTVLKIKDKIGGLISRHYKTEVIEEEWY